MGLKFSGLSLRVYLAPYYWLRLCMPLSSGSESVVVTKLAVADASVTELM